MRLGSRLFSMIDTDVRDIWVHVRDICCSRQVFFPREKSILIVKTAKFSGVGVRVDIFNIHLVIELTCVVAA